MGDPPGLKEHLKIVLDRPQTIQHLTHLLERIGNQETSEEEHTAYSAVHGASLRTDSVCTKGLRIRITKGGDPAGVESSKRQNMPV